MIVLSQIQGDSQKVKQLPALLKPSAARKKKQPQEWVQKILDAPRRTDAELLQLIDETLAMLEQQK